MPGIAVFMLGLGFWLSGYFLQRFEDPTSQERLFKVPDWLNLIFGKPRPDKQVTIWGMTIQIMGYLLAVGAILGWLIIPELETRIIVLSAWFILILIAGALFGNLVTRLFR